MIHDLIIRDAKIVDGTGADAYSGDIAIDGRMLTQVGGTAGPGKREITANGAMGAPGWVDVHTHYDGQVTWDPLVSPSSWHGVTSIVMGNCGVGFAPVVAERQPRLVPALRRDLLDAEEALLRPHEQTLLLALLLQLVVLLTQGS